jgi:hypothetical protein
MSEFSLKVSNEIQSQHHYRSLWGEFGFRADGRT